MPFGLGFGEVLVILLIFLLLFGAKRIPEIAGSLGKGITQFKRSLNDVQDQVRDADVAKPLAPPAASDAMPAARLDQPVEADRPGPKRLIG